MLEIQNQAHFEEVLAFADKIGLRKQLDEKLTYLDTYAEHGDRGKSRCTLSKDWAPYSFSFVIQVRGERPGSQYATWFVGGLIYHGPHDGHGSGSYPTLAVTLEPTHGWQVHT